MKTITEKDEILFGPFYTSEGEIKENGGRTINPKVAFTSYKDQEHEDDDRVYQQLVKAQKESFIKEMKILSEVLGNGNPPVKNLPNDKIMKSYREFSEELEEKF